MNLERSFVRKVLYLVGIVLLLVPLFILGQPATSARPDSGGKLAKLQSTSGMSEAQLGDIDPASETIKLATLGMRGVASQILWEKANTFKMKKDWTNLKATLEQLAKLEPHFVAVWLHQAWNLSYNVSAEFDDYRERYRWVIKGIEFLQKGIHYNKKEPKLVEQLGWFISQKIGRADEHVQFRRLFKLDVDFHGIRAEEFRDNWLVGKEYFRQAEEMVDLHGADLKKTTPVVFYSHAPMCQMNYSDALEKDGSFGEIAKYAWIKAEKDWFDFGQREIGTSKKDVRIRLNEKEAFMEQAAKRTALIEAMAPKLRKEMREERIKALSPAQRNALKLEPGKRKGNQHELARLAEEQVRVTDEQLARRMPAAKRNEAVKLSAEVVKLNQQSETVGHYRQIINFEYWRRKAKIEQVPEILEARRLTYEADKASAEGRLNEARRMYDEAFRMFRKVFDKKDDQGKLLFPRLVEDDTFGQDMIEVVDRYRKLLGKRDEPFPKDFPLQDIIRLHDKKR